MHFMMDDAKIAIISKEQKKVFHKFVLKSRVLSFALRNHCFSKKLLSPLNPRLTSRVAVIIIKILFRDKKGRKMKR